MSHAQPSVLLISADDLPRNILGVYGAQHGLTPNLDALARSSGAAVFDSAFTVSPLCTPSRFALLTGNYPEDALSYRIDGHGHDMLHWCLPGVPDWLIAVLFRFVLVDE